MNKLIKTIPLLVALLSLNACKKDDITVEKNESTSWEIDKNIVDNDIRTRLGYDPLKQQAYFYQIESELPLYSLGEVPIANTQKVTMHLFFSHKVTADTQVSLLYDASKYDALKEKYAGYELGTENLVQFSHQLTVPKDTNVVHFEFSLSENISLDKKVILPFKLQVPEGVNILQGNECFVLKISPQKVQLEFYRKRNTTSRIIKKDLATGATTINNEVINFTVTSNVKLPNDFYLGLVRDDSYTKPDLAPMGIETELPRIPFKDLSEGTFTFKIQHLENITQAATLPLQLVLYTADGHPYPIENMKPNVYFTIQYVFPPNNLVATNTDQTPAANKISQVTGNFILKSAPGNNFNNMLDGNLTSFADFPTARPQGLSFNFNEVKKVKYIRLKVDDTTPITSLSLSVNNGNNLGNVHFTATQGWYLITFKTALPLTNVNLRGFDRNKTFKIHEVEFYEEE